ncbi:MAG TPA: nicotinamide riboside transporter PnuC [Sphingorhabdus lacus]|jgi:nicotinamide mononucleotide transporter|nr:nicotinamide riboside transporter PnuC [Sphingorhabdus lacus]HPV69133.1 nicotinamide riboside transporter PnuC [Sphingorhabdus lacus]
MSLIELAAVLLGLANIVLIIRRSVWNFPVAVAMVSLYFFIFRDARLYSDAGLQVFFLVVNLYGWWNWHRSKGDDGAVEVRRLPATGYALWIAGSIVAIWAWGSFMGSYTQTSYPYWDASIAMLSVAGQILMARRFVENWHWWIIVNLISIPLYVAKDLHLTAGLYGVFLVLAIGGLVAWRKAEVAE